MVGGASPILSRRRATALIATLAAFTIYDAVAGTLPEARTAIDVAVLACLIIPLAFAGVWLALPLARARGLLLVGAGFGVLAVVLHLAGAGALHNVAKLAAYTLIGFWLLDLFEDLWWVAVVALLIPIVDSISVWRGPTEYVVTEEPGIFERVSVAFGIPGEDASANLGPPDVLFFALFLATAARYRLRVGWTWLAMTALLSLTLVLTATTDVNGLPALPAICLGFLAPNADLIWRNYRAR